MAEQVAGEASTPGARPDKLHPGLYVLAILLGCAVMIGAAVAIDRWESRHD